MLRLNILKQLQRITLVSYAKHATVTSTLCCDTNKLTQSVTQFPLNATTRNIFISCRLEKYNRKSGAKDVDSDSDDEREPEFKDERDSKVVKTKVNSLRADRSKKNINQTDT